MNILIITFDYTPFISANSFRWTSVAESFAKNGHNVYVITGWRPNMKKLELINGVQVYRVGGSFVEPIRSTLRRPVAAACRNEQQSNSYTHAKLTLSGVLKKLHDHTWKNIYWPDFACTWYFSALGIAKALFSEYSFSCYITASIPFTAHLVGNKLKQLYPTSRWIVDISDPFCFESSNINNKLIYTALNIATERKVFHNAQAISVLTNSQKQKYLEYFPEASYKIFVNPNILSNDAINIDKHHKSSLLLGCNKKMVFLGNLSPEIRSPDFLLKLFTILISKPEFDKFELHFFGVHDYCKESFARYSQLIGKNIILHGPVPRSKALEVMNHADYLVNIGNNNPYQEPSKVIEYASTGKPVINIMSIYNDSSANLLRNYPAVYNVFCQDDIKLANIINDLANFMLSPPNVNTEVLNELITPYRIESVVNNYESMIFGY